MKSRTFSERNFKTICKKLAAKDKEFARILSTHGYPPMWTRPNTFESLVHIILEQQVSLASALASLKKLQQKTRGITPRKILKLTNEELRNCYVSRQKTVYIRVLAEAIVKKQLDLDELSTLDNDSVRARLTQLKGIGNWTTDVYLMFVLRRNDVFPIGDLAAVNALKRVKNIEKNAAREQLIKLAETWKPYRTIATMLLWHFYLSSRVNRK